MLKILIVDDEPIFRMGLRAGISWSEYGCEIIGEASTDTKLFPSFKSRTGYYLPGYQNARHGWH